MERTPIFLNHEGQGWHLRPARTALMRGASLVLGAVLVAASVPAWEQGNVAAGLLLAAVAAAFLAMAVTWAPRRNARTASTEAGPALLLPINPPPIGPTVAAALLGPILAVGGVIALIEREWIGIGMLLLGALFVLGAVGGMRARFRGVIGVLLLPEGLLMRTALTPTRLRWEEVAGVRAHWRRRVRGAGPSPDEVVHNWLTVDVAGTERAVSVDAAAFAVDPEVALAVLRHYLEHPEDRAELGTDRALERVEALSRTLR